MPGSENAAPMGEGWGNHIADVDAYPGLMLLISLDGRVVRANAFVKRALGYSPEEVKGLGYEDLVHPDDTEAVEAGLEQVLSGRPVLHNEFRVKHRDGNYRWFAWESATPTDECFLMTGRDISPQKSILEQQRILLEGCPDALLAFGAGGRVAWVNAAAERLFGYPRPLLKGLTIDRLLTGIPDSVMEPIPADPTRCEALHRDGSRTPVAVHSALLNEGDYSRLLSVRECGPLKGEAPPSLGEPQKRAVIIRDPGSVYASGREAPGVSNCIAAGRDPGGIAQRLIELGFDMVLLHCDGHIVDINPKGAGLLGASSPDELEGRLVYEIVHPDHCEVTREGIRHTVLEQYETRPMELRILRLDGSLVDVEVTSVPADIDGRPATCTFARDITRRKRAETALQAREYYFQTLAKVAPVGIYQSNTEGEVVYANRRCNYILGTATERLTGSNWRAYVHPQDFDRVLAQWQRAVDGGRPFRAEHRYCRPDGTVVWVLNQAVAERDRSGKVLGYIGTITDITELKHLHQQLADAEAHSRKIAELAFDMVMLERDHLIVELNDGGARLLGLGSPREAIGRSIAELHPTEVRTEVFERIRSAVERWEPAPLAETKLVRPDGRIVDVEGTAIPVLNNGHPATYTVYRDISMRKHKERVLQERRHHFQTLARATPVGIFQSSAEWECTYVNERYVEITGHGYHATLGSGWKQQIHKDDRARVSTELARSLREEEPPFSAEYRICRPDGKIIWVLCQAVAEWDSAGNRLGYIGSITDITRSKTTELELQCYRDRLEDMVAARTRELDVVNRELEAFSYSVSHDLRAPLRAMNGFTQALQEEYLEQFDEQARFYLNRIRVNSTHMGALIDALLELSRVSQVDVHREEVDLGVLARNVVDELRIAEPERDVEVVIGDDLKAVGDRKLLRCLVQNLLSNAWKYTGRTENPRIEVGRRTVVGDEVFYVSDNGAGFDMGCAEDLFRAFRRLHAPSEFEGTGLGLATVQRIVNRHGGRVWAEAEEGQGAAFFFVLQP